MAIDPISKSQNTTKPENNKLPDQAQRNPKKQNDSSSSSDDSSSTSGGVTKDKDGNYTGADVTV